MWNYGAQVLLLAAACAMALLLQGAAAQTPTTTPCTCSTANANTATNELITVANDVFESVRLCENGFYCRCSDGVRQKCTAWWGDAWKFDAGRQTCVPDLGCRDVINPVTWASTTRVPVTRGPVQCSCNQTLPYEYQLNRDAATRDAKCDGGYYCHCTELVELKCVSWWGENQWKWDETRQRCVENFDCSKFTY